MEIDHLLLEVRRHYDPRAFLLLVPIYLVVPVAIAKGEFGPAIAFFVAALCMTEKVRQQEQKWRADR